MMLSAVQQVLDDKDFKIKSAVAIKAHDVAAKLMEWSSEKENKGILTKFSDELIPTLEEVFVGTDLQVPSLTETSYGNVFSY